MYICCTEDDFQILNCSCTILYRFNSFPLVHFISWSVFILLLFMLLLLFKGLYYSLWVKNVQFCKE
ncbi:hypothetical protein DPEC_G00046450 [Dallia pectoralis]|uniref:Uncharacterized protein n=1 Tax=Dallia pectoralis TaxID=75939 RepID=A0ACC2HA12_DALPE|nr:hypothetical protein DPEC_G00046450 [Dallia pectoralis]